MRAFFGSLFSIRKPIVWKERMEMFGLGWVGLAEDLITIVTFGIVVPNFRAWYLFTFLED